MKASIVYTELWYINAEYRMLKVYLEGLFLLEKMTLFGLINLLGFSEQIWWYHHLSCDNLWWKNTSVLWHLHMFWGRTRQKFGPTPSPSSQWAHKASQSWPFNKKQKSKEWAKKTSNAAGMLLKPTVASEFEQKKPGFLTKYAVFRVVTGTPRKTATTISKMTQQNLYNCTTPLGF